MAISNELIDNPEIYLRKDNFAFFNNFADKSPHFSVTSRIEPHTCAKDYGRALAFEVYDPLWILTRQWQYGRFKGNDCGSAVTAKIKMSRLPLEFLEAAGPESGQREYSSDTPLEYEVEKRDRRVTPYIRICSAAHLTRRLRRLRDSRAGALLLTLLQNEYPLEDFSVGREDSLEGIKTAQNKSLKSLYAVFGRRIFDGYRTARAWQDGTLKKRVDEERLGSNMVNALFDAYLKWFAEKYFPVSGMVGEPRESPCWNEEKLGYELSTGLLNSRYIAEDYDTGRLSWHSFDGQAVTEYTGDVSSGMIRLLKGDSILKFIVGGQILDDEDSRVKMVTYLPVTANFPGAPDRRLWAIESRGVNFGNQKDTSLLANSVVMQYTSMYSHDWMITPLEVEAGCVVSVEGIVVTDTFGERIFIDRSAEENDGLSEKVRFDDRWSLFSISKREAWKNNDFAPYGNSLLIPPTVQRAEESRPLEEVQFLRDEMANMMWGVETVVDNGCGGTWDGKDMSKSVLAAVDERNRKSEELMIEGCDYSYLLQNRVPLNWIPFIPRRIKGQAREIRFQRGQMPVFLEGRYEPVRPSTSLLETKRSESGKVIPRFINEEELNSYGVKLVNTAQRTRWFLGASFNWTGFRTVIDNVQANSGLMFDELIDTKETEKTITTSRKK